MKYLSGVHSETTAEYFATEPDFGLMAQPRSSYLDYTGRYLGGYAYDNGAFGAFLKGKPFDAAAWRRPLAKVAVTTGCLFVVVPDVVGDHDGTRQAWDLYASEVPASLPRAFVLQNGCTDLAQVPNDADAVFIGGDDAYKLGPDAARVCWQAQRAGLWVHMGRVNGERRFLRAVAMGCDSADGTYIRFGPQQLMCANVAGWLAASRTKGAQLDVLDVA